MLQESFKITWTFSLIPFFRVMKEKNCNSLLAESQNLVSFVVCGLCIYLPVVGGRKEFGEVSGFVVIIL